uniref:C-type lectin domain-containing protein n=1 Tax=Romanomermis culicivorax TaxID=13658 RepID=A0A915K1Q7_ROMCU
MTGKAIFIGAFKDSMNGIYEWYDYYPMESWVWKQEFMNITLSPNFECGTLTYKDWDAEEPNGQTCIVMRHLQRYR